MIVKDLYVWEPFIRDWVRIATDAAGCNFLGEREFFQRQGFCTAVATRVPRLKTKIIRSAEATFIGYKWE